MGLYERYVLPRLIHYACRHGDVREERERLLPRARGRVLEVGVGSGLNLAFYDGAAVERVTGLDPSRPLLARAASESIARAPVPTALVEGTAESIPLPDGCVDTVVTTYTLCSIPEPHRALAEIRRVLAPGGRFLFAEHGRSPDEDVRTWQRRLTPVWKRLSGGCHLDRPIVDLVASAGFRIEGVEERYLPDAPRFAGWNFSGEAIPG